MNPPGVYITLSDNSCQYFSFSDLHQWKHFADTYTRKDVSEIGVRCYSVNNSQPIYKKFAGDELENIEFCYVASTILGKFTMNFVAVYVPHYGGNYRLLINESHRLIAQGCTDKPRSKRFILKDV